MNLIDNNQIKKLTPITAKCEIFYMAPEIVEEYTLGGGSIDNLPEHLQLVAGLRNFHQPRYIHHFAQNINVMSGRSFFNLTGFGDVSIVATIFTLIDGFAQARQNELFDPTETITVFTADGGLAKHIHKTFSVNEVEVTSFP